MDDRDVVLRKAFQMAEDKIVHDTIEAVKGLPDHTFSKRYERRKKKLIRKFEKRVLDNNLNTEEVNHEEHTGHELYRLSSKTIKVMLVAAILMILFTITAIAIEPIRDFFVRVYNEYTQVVFNNTGGDDYLYSKYTYIPEGYVFDDYGKSRISQWYVYKDSEEKFINISTQKNNESIHSLNTEEIKITELTISGHQALYYENAGMRTLAWSTGQYNHFIDCKIEDESLTIEELIKIAESRVELKK